MFLDYTLQTPEERSAFVDSLIKDTPPSKLTKSFLETLSNYILDAISKQEKKSKTILTDNRLTTINKREIHYQELAAKFEGGEDSLYGYFRNDKDIIFNPQISISDYDIEHVPGLKDLHTELKRTEELCKTAKGKDRFVLKKQLIQMRQDQYVLKNAHYQPIVPLNLPHNKHQHLNINDFIDFRKKEHIELLLCNYSKLRQYASDFNGDTYYLLSDLGKIVKSALAHNQIYYDILRYKILGKTNKEIQKLLTENHGLSYSAVYLSKLWRNTIPKLIANEAEKQWLIWHYTYEEKGQWKKCNRCGQIKLAHTKFFSYNPGTRDGFYSICKECRNKKTKKEEIKDADK